MRAFSRTVNTKNLIQQMLKGGDWNGRAHITATIDPTTGQSKTSGDCRGERFVEHAGRCPAGVAGPTAANRVRAPSQNDCPASHHLAQQASPRDPSTPRHRAGPRLPQRRNALWIDQSRASEINTAIQVGQASACLVLISVGSERQTG